MPFDTHSQRSREMAQALGTCRCRIGKAAFRDHLGVDRRTGQNLPVADLKNLRMARAASVARMLSPNQLPYWS